MLTAQREKYKRHENKCQQNSKQEIHAERKRTDDNQNGYGDSSIVSNERREEQKTKEEGHKRDAERNELEPVGGRVQKGLMEDVQQQEHDNQHER